YLEFCQRCHSVVPNRNSQSKRTSPCHSFLDSAYRSQFLSCPSCYSPHRPMPDINFYDGTFNLGDYGAPLTWSSDPSVITSIQQITSGGNPGDALEMNLTFQAGTYDSWQGFIHNGLELRSGHDRPAGICQVIICQVTPCQATNLRPPSILGSSSSPASAGFPLAAMEE